MQERGIFSSMSQLPQNGEGELLLLTRMFQEELGMGLIFVRSFGRSTPWMSLMIDSRNIKYCTRLQVTTFPFRWHIHDVDPKLVQLALTTTHIHNILSLAH